MGGRFNIGPELAVNTQSSSYNLTESDIGTLVTTSAGVTVVSGTFTTGDAITVYNDSGSDITITQGASTTMYMAGTATTGDRTLAQRGVATVLCVGADEFTISGGGLT